MTVEARRLQKLMNMLFEMMNRMGLKSEWVLCVSALALQELAVKIKLEELGEKISESDFQVLAKQLEDSLKKHDIQVPLILLSIIRSDRHIRAKLLHEGHHYEVSKSECEALIFRTKSLIDSLYPSISDRFDDIFAKAKELTTEEIQTYIDGLDSSIYDNVILEILDKLELLKDTISKDEINLLLIILDKILRLGSYEERVRRMKYVIDTLLGASTISKYELLTVVNKLLYVKSIRDWVVSENYTDDFIELFASSGSFKESYLNANIIMILSNYMTLEQLNKIIEVAIKNNQIYWPKRTKNILRKFIKKYEDKLESTKVKELYIKFKEYRARYICELCNHLDYFFVGIIANQEKREANWYSARARVYQLQSWLFLKIMK